MFRRQWRTTYFEANQQLDHPPCQHPGMKPMHAWMIVWSLVESPYPQHWPVVICFCDSWAVSSRLAAQLEFFHPSLPYRTETWPAQTHPCLDVRHYPNRIRSKFEPRLPEAIYFAPAQHEPVRQSKNRYEYDRLHWRFGCIWIWPGD